MPNFNFSLTGVENTDRAEPSGCLKCIAFYNYRYSWLHHERGNKEGVNDATGRNGSSSMGSNDVRLLRLGPRNAEGVWRYVTQIYTSPVKHLRRQYSCPRKVAVAASAQLTISIPPTNNGALNQNTSKFRS